MIKISEVVSLLNAIDLIRERWTSGDLEGAVKNAVKVADDISQRYQLQPPREPLIELWTRPYSSKIGKGRPPR